jgi:hypothetical protein
MNCTSAMASLPTTLPLGISKEMTPSRRLVTATEPMPSAHRVTLDKGSLFVECPLYLHSAKKLSVDPFTSLFVERIRWHSAKSHSLPSAQLTSTRQRDHQRALLSIPLTLGGTQQSLLLCRVLRPQHSAKMLYRCPGVPSLPSAMVMTLDKVPLCRVLHSQSDKNILFICFYYSIQTNKRYIT